MRNTEINWIPVATKELPDKTKEATAKSYLVTLPVSDGTYITTLSDWGKLTEEDDRGRLFAEDPDYKDFIYDGWAFGDEWDGVIDSVDRAIAWAPLPEPYKPD